MKTFATVVAIAALVVTVAVIGPTEEAGPRDGSGAGVGAPGHGLDHMFADHDANKDGKITKDEFPGPDAIFDRMDADGDGSISEAEGKAAEDAGMRMRKNMTGAGDPAERWANLLEHADADKDGKISKDEFRGPDAAFARLDANGDGFITEDEAKAAGDRMREGRGQQGFARMDEDGDGNVTRDEWNAAFDKLDTNGDGVLNQEDRPERGAGQGQGQGMGRGAGQGAGQGQGNGPNA